MSQVLVQWFGAQCSVLYVLNSGHTGCSQPTAMDRHNTENGRNRLGTLSAALTMHSHIWGNSCISHAGTCLPLSACLFPPVWATAPHFACTWYHLQCYACPTLVLCESNFHTCNHAHDAHLCYISIMWNTPGTHNAPHCFEAASQEFNKCTQ